LAEGTSATWILGLQVGDVGHQHSRALHRAGASCLRLLVCRRKFRDRPMNELTLLR